MDPQLPNTPPAPVTPQVAPATPAPASAAPVTPQVPESPAHRSGKLGLFAAIGIIVAGVAVLGGVLYMSFAPKPAAPASPVVAVQPTSAPVASPIPTPTPVSLDSASQTLDSANLNEISSGLDQNTKDLGTF